MPDQVAIRIPASTAHVALVRATASSLAALLDFTYDRIMDIHIAIDEVCSRIIATSVPQATRLAVTFDLEDGGLRISAAGDSPLKDGTVFLTTWSRAILDAVTDGMEILDLEGVACATFTIARG